MGKAKVPIVALSVGSEALCLVDEIDALLGVAIVYEEGGKVGEGFRVSRRDSAVEIDSVMATLLAVYGAETLRPSPIQVF